METVPGQDLAPVHENKKLYICKARKQQGKADKMITLEMKALNSCLHTKHTQQSLLY